MTNKFKLLILPLLLATQLAHGAASSWSTTAGSNTSLIDGGDAPSTIDDAIREVAADVRAGYALVAETEAALKAWTIKGGYAIVIGNSAALDQSPRVYKWDASDTTADDGEIYLIPDDITHPAAGRWIKVDGPIVVGDSTDSTSPTTGSIVTAGGIGAGLSIFAQTINAHGDTAAGDPATMGQTAAEGLILTGQGSTNDVSLKNDADALVLSILTGTTTVEAEGTLRSSTTGGFSLLSEVASTTNPTLIPHNSDLTSGWSGNGSGEIYGVSGGTYTIGFTANNIDIPISGSTTQTVLTVDDADALTTGGIANFSSNSSDSNTRSLVTITNDHSSATGATGLTITQDANQKALRIDAAGVTSNPIIDISSNALTTGTIATFSSNSSDTGSRTLLQIINNHTSATNAIPLQLQQDAPEGFVDFAATSAASVANPITTWTTGGAIVGFVRIEINGTEYWMPFYSAPSS